MIHINVIPDQAAQKKGFAHYPEDFPHLTHGEQFVAWKSGDDWEIETTLTGQKLAYRVKKFMKDCEEEPRVWEVQYRRRDGKVDFLWYGSLVDESEAKSRCQDMAAHGMEVLGLHAIDRLPTNREYLAMLKSYNEEDI